LTAAISDAGVGLQPETGKRSSKRANRKKGLYLISAIDPFKASANPAVRDLFGRQYDENILWVRLSRIVKS
jgi:hypothetical protein